MEFNAKTVLERTLAMDLPQISECRHILITGDTASGKTTMLRRIFDAIDPNLKIRLLSEGRELEDLQSRVYGHGELVPHMADVILECVSRLQCDVLVVSEIHHLARYSALRMTTVPGPALIATFNDSTYGRDDPQLLDMLRKETANGHGQRMAIVRMKRDPKDGRRMVDSVTAL